MTEDLQKLRYPIGQFEPPSPIDENQIERWIGDIEALPADLRRTVEGLTDSQLDTPIVPGAGPPAKWFHHLPRQPHEQFHPVQVGADRGASRDQGLFRGSVGGTAGLLGRSGLSISGSAGGAPSTLGGALAFPHPPRTSTGPSFTPNPAPQTWRKTIGSYAWHGRHHLGAHIRETLSVREGWNRQ